MKSGTEGQFRASRGPAWLVSNTSDQQAYHLCSASPHRHLLIFIADADKENGDRRSPPSSRGVIQQIKVSERSVDTAAGDRLWCFVIHLLAIRLFILNGAGRGGIAACIRCLAGVEGNLRS